MATKPNAKKAAPAKKAAADRKSAVKDAAKKDAALDTKPEAGELTENTEAVEEETTGATREAPTMEAAAEPTDFDHLLDLARAVDPTFGSEQSKEGKNHFLIRVISALAETTTEQFDSLPATAQTWYEDAVAAGNASQELPEPAGYAAPAALAKEKTVAKKAAPKKAAGEKKAAAPKTPREPKAPKEKKPREPGIVQLVRRLIIQNADQSQDQIRELMADRKMICKPSTFAATWTDTHQSIRIVKEEKHWK